MKYNKGILLPALLALAGFAAGKKDAPLVEVETFDNELVNIQYFEDTEIAIATEFDTGVVYRSADAGKEWKKLDFRTLLIVKHPYDNQVAVGIGESEHQITYDQGKSWRSFKTEYPPSWAGPIISFHATDSKKILFHTMEHPTNGIGATYYTEDGFKSDPKPLRDDRRSCTWAIGTDLFLLDDDKREEYNNRVICIATGKFSDREKDMRLLVSDKYFKDGDGHEPVMSSGRTVSGMTSIAPVKGFIVAAAKSDHSNELALYVTKDTDIWHRAQFGEGKIEEDAYTILESTNYSIQVDVMTQRHAFIGSLYSSNSNGTYFTKNVEHTNRNREGYVDFEKISNIQGIVMVNVVDNHEKATNPMVEKKLKSKISFDDGRTFEDLKVKDSDKKLHLHSVTNLHNSGRVFSSPAPGIVMGVGNTGEHLGKYTDGDLWVSDDAGLTWELALTEAHKYEFGNKGSVLVAIYDEGETDKIMYSLHHGHKDSWKEVPLDFKLIAHELTTTPDSTSLKFLLYGARPKKGGGREYVMVHLDFAGLHEDECKDKDFEEWAARVDDDNKATCVMGQKQYFRRRKADADCFVPEDFKEPLPKFEPCDCDEDLDYECDFNFVPHFNDGKKECRPSAALEPPKGACKGDDKTYKGPSGWRKIPGNQCKGKTKKDEEVERDCKEVSEPPAASNEITHKKNKFKGSRFREYYYLERGAEVEGKDETVVMLTDELEAWVSHNHGKDWDKATDTDILAIYPHQYNNDYVYFLTGTEKVYYSENRAHGKLHKLKAPHPPNNQKLQIMQFHPKESDWIIWVGGDDCEKFNDPDCHTVASVSQNNGQEWKKLLPYVKKCAFAWRAGGQVLEEERIFCEQYTKEQMGAPLELITSTDFFAKKEVKFTSVVDFATMSEFIVVATKAEDGKSLKLDASLNGVDFAEAKFPPKFEVDHQTAYTVLDSSTHAVFLHVTVNPREGQEYGAIIKSNSNGTSYVMSLPNVNRNGPGYVDFEKMQGIEGVAVANVVSNVDAVNKGAKKEKKTYITHNDGADWELLQAPEKDSEGKPYECKGKDKSECSLHLHGYTERVDPRETYSSPTAVGFMMGVGNVGKSLGTIGEASTFMTTDAGVTWKEIKKGNYAWEFGDQGSVIVLVHRGKDTKDLYYSLDAGETWNSYEFSNHAISVDAISTVPSDTSLNFLLWGRDAKELVTVNVDFSQLKDFQKPCDLPKDNPTAGDYDLWAPQHPLLKDGECLFGHEAQYLRKKRDAKCRNEKAITSVHNITHNCECSRRDFECNFNYERKDMGECVLIPGLSEPDASAACKTKGVKEYWDNTPYRRIPISTCEGGLEMDKVGDVHPCPGYEEEFKKKHGISGFGLFMAIVLPFAAAAGIGYYIWRNWDGKFGRIRLGETSSFSGESPWIKWPVAAVSGLVAVVAALPLLVGSLWRLVGGRFGFGGGYGYVGQRFTSRSSFSRGRGQYAVVDEVEGELLGEESDEEV